MINRKYSFTFFSPEDIYFYPFYIDTIYVSYVKSTDS